MLVILTALQPAAPTIPALAPRPATRERAGWQPRFGLISNPNAGRNRKSPERIARLQAIAGPSALVMRTPSLAEIRQAVITLIDSRAPLWVIDGGDGALHCVLNTALDVLGPSGLASLPPILPLRAGTIDFVARRLRLSGSGESILARLNARLGAGETPEIVPLHSLRMAMTAASGSTIERVGFATAIAGIGQAFFAEYYADTSPGPAAIARVVARATAGLCAERLKLGATVPGLRRAGSIFEARRLRVSVDGQALAWSEYNAVHAGAIDVDLGGVFRFFPLAARARVLHLHAGYLRPARIVAALPRLITGRSIRGPTFFEGPGRTLRVESDDGRPIDPVIDGERYFGASAIDVDSGPEVLLARV